MTPREYAERAEAVRTKYAGLLVEAEQKDVRAEEIIAEASRLGVFCDGQMPNHASHVRTAAYNDMAPITRAFLFGG